MNTFSARSAGGVLAIIMAASFGLMLYASFTDSGTMDELAHIPAGVSYVRELDFRLNPEHPPLVKALAGLPTLFMDITFPTNIKAWQTDINGQWDMGGALLYDSGNDANSIIRWARLGPMLLTLALIFLVWWWARERMGNWWALLPAFLVGWSPSFLAHGHYVTTDVGAALGIVFATYMFVRYLESPSRKHLWLAGIAFGIAQALKFSAVLLVPFFVLLVLIVFARQVARTWRTTADRIRFFARTLLSSGLRLIAIFAIGYVLIVYPLYFIFTINYPIERQVSDTTSILASFANGPTRPGEMCAPMRCVAELDIWASGNALTRPLAHYALGVLMVIQRSAGGNNGYFLGEVSSTGWGSYFPTVYAIKEPLPVLIMVALALLLSLKSAVQSIFSKGRTVRDRILSYLDTHLAECAMILFVAIYWAWSLQSPLNIGFRHLFPTLPFIYILTAGVLKRWVVPPKLPEGTTPILRVILWMKNAFASTGKLGLLMVLVLWLFFSTLSAAPYFLSYFNRFGEGVMGGYRYVTDSNYDWGQDLLRLTEWVNAHPDVDRIAVDYFGAGRPSYYMPGKAEGWWSARGNPKDQGIRYLAVSVNALQGALGTPAPGFKRPPQDEYAWLVELFGKPKAWGSVPVPYARAGTSIFIYRL